MREIKFRAWDSQEMIYEPSLYTDDFARNINQYFEYWQKIVDENERMIFMQYTGLKDINGKEIYEGDIIEFDNEIKLIVYWDNVLGGFALKNLTNTAVVPLTDMIKPIKVLGNIYENPELLKETKK